MRSSWIMLATLIAGLCARPLTAQQGQRGIGIVKAPPADSVGTRRAVIVGISRYKNVASLAYAAADAKAFAAFLQSPVGGSVPASNIRLLLDTAATRIRILDEVQWLVEASQADDEAIIYFAGHGDIQPGPDSRGSKQGNRESKQGNPEEGGSKNDLGIGFLLAYEARRDRHYFSEGAVNSMDLMFLVQEIAKRDAKVWLITDACRSGNIISGSVDDARAIAPLMRDWRGVASLVSSGPNQLSQEGRQWGNGHGVFTYYLLRGLSGAANTDSDEVVTLEEAARFVQDSVRVATGGNQVPERSGYLGRIAAWMPQVQLATVASGGTNDAVGTRGIGAASEPDSAVLHLIDRLSATLRQGALLTPDGESAWDIYVRLSGNPAAASVLPDVRSDLRTAFQEDAQQVIADFMAGGSRQPDAQRIRNAATELTRASDLLGKTSMLAPTLTARRLFLEGYADIQKGDFPTSLGLLRRSIALEPQGYSYSGLGLAFLGTNQLDSARQAFAKAILRNPRRATPLLGQAVASLEVGDAAGALVTLDTAVAVVEPQASLQLARALALLALGRRADAIAAYGQARALDSRVTNDHYASDLLPYTAAMASRITRLRAVVQPSTSGRK